MKSSQYRQRDHTNVVQQTHGVLLLVWSLVSGDGARYYLTKAEGHHDRTGAHGFIAVRALLRMLPSL